MDSTLVSILVTLVILTTVAAGGYWSYQEGHLDPLINSIGAYIAKAKAEAALKQVQGKEGLKAAEEKTSEFPHRPPATAPVPHADGACPGCAGPEDRSLGLMPFWRRGTGDRGARIHVSERRVWCGGNYSSTGEDGQEA
ncbi:hypothetical protein BGZ61DRAFT_472290 [Ilyonectria robusta]|uniref:uncharacterized protein n=1 Tax=Ilyonectria robusta TaxID=1079257 RepID=UPI001E8CC54F|nr:uncharacterized protein BGZ61DRAFT_472290 [Ilyonectria robusta]KAH8735910.1 hypothetical protein BGZ61DRAFT_472290 [Ilyonectria robusta]